MNLISPILFQKYCIFKKKLLVSLLLFVASFSHAQVITNSNDTTYVHISGIVSDLGPVPNVVVFEKGKDNVVVTDKDGLFTIRIPVEHFTENVYLRFEMFGIEPVEKQVYLSTNELNLELNSSGSLLAKKYSWEFKKPEIDVPNVIFKALNDVIEKVKISRN